MKLLFQVLPSVPFGPIARVYGRNEYGEYVVRFYARNTGKLIPSADYFTKNRLDACYTAIAEIHGIRAVQDIRQRVVHN